MYILKTMQNIPQKGNIYSKMHKIIKNTAHDRMSLAQTYGAMIPLMIATEAA